MEGEGSLMGRQEQLQRPNMCRVKKEAMYLEKVSQKDRRSLLVSPSEHQLMQGTEETVLQHLLQVT